jgi:hypothetical protein
MLFHQGRVSPSLKNPGTLGVDAAAADLGEHA